LAALQGEVYAVEVRTLVEYTDTNTNTGRFRDRRLHRQTVPKVACEYLIRSLDTFFAAKANGHSLLELHETRQNARTITD
jgi:hypothetical protein